MLDYQAELPSNRKFGFFFSFLFAVAVVYFFYIGNKTYAGVFCFVSLILLLITLVNSEILLPLNKVWMRVGILLGMIVSPIILGVIFFGLFTPIALLMRISGRDELRLKFMRKASHWITRREPIKAESFKLQF